MSIVWGCQRKPLVRTSKDSIQSKDTGSSFAQSYLLDSMPTSGIYTCTSLCRCTPSAAITSAIVSTFFLIWHQLIWIRATLAVCNLPLGLKSCRTVGYQTHGRESTTPRLHYLMISHYLLLECSLGPTRITSWKHHHQVSHSPRTVRK